MTQIVTRTSPSGRPGAQFRACQDHQADERVDHDRRDAPHAERGRQDSVLPTQAQFPSGAPSTRRICKSANTPRRHAMTAAMETMRGQGVVRDGPR